MWLSGEGRRDGPGHSAKYGTYTMIDQITDTIVDCQVVQVSEVTSSNAMEREGYIFRVRGKTCSITIRTLSS